MPFIEIVTVPVSDAFIANPESFKESLRGIKTVEGYQSAFHGMQIEDKKTGYFVSVWTTYEHREKLISDPKYAGLVEKLKAAFAGPPVRHHIHFTGDPTAALSAPVTVLGVATLKAGESPEKMAALGKEFAEALDATAGTHKPAVYGQSIEDKNKFFLITGWDSVEAHKAMVDGGSLKPIASQILAIVDFSAGHAILQNHS
ncbi:hypothetical protein B0H12DRAFT_1232777 [Mycena haematopus]|nr:hypothetical protein B0H12DRAFT_1232777 [Mycena haematopus]